MTTSHETHDQELTTSQGRTTSERLRRGYNGVKRVGKVALGASAVVGAVTIAMLAKDLVSGLPDFHSKQSTTAAFGPVTTRVYSHADIGLLDSKSKIPFKGNVHTDHWGPLPDCDIAVDKTFKVSSSARVEAGTISVTRMSKHAITAKLAGELSLTDPSVKPVKDLIDTGGTSICSGTEELNGILNIANFGIYSSAKVAGACALKSNVGEDKLDTSIKTFVAKTYPDVTAKDVITIEKPNYDGNTKEIYDASVTELQDTIGQLEKDAIKNDEYDTAHISITQMVACDAHHIA